MILDKGLRAVILDKGLRTVILDTARNPFHLSLPEASNIKVRRPNLRKQKKFVDSILLNCVQVEFRFARLVQSELPVTFPRSIGFANFFSHKIRTGTPHC